MEQLMQGNQAETAKRDEQTMFAFIEEQKQSGLTVKAFCEERQIPPHFFYYWNKKYRDRNNPTKNSETSFTLLDIQNKVSGSLFCELITPAGGRLKFYLL